MSRFRTLLLSLALAGCSQAYSDRAASPAPLMVVADGRTPVAAPYGFEIVDGSGRALEAYFHNGRHYVLGEAGERYLIRITNPTDRRVEAVVTVDGLDVIDGEPGDLRKRGYVVPPRGDLEIEGFRTSTADVATFRFSSVAASYAGRKGKARNVGVIAVALFEEVAAQELILEQPPPPPVTYYGGSGYGGSVYRDAEKKDMPADGRAARGGYVGGAASTAEAGGDSVAARPYVPVPVEEYDEPPPPPPCCTQREHRPGLGTEYGEQRYSAATWTRFVRASETPIAVAELRYNDAPGLAALGIPVAPPVSAEEVTKRETADPFPGDGNFSRPPAGIR